MLDLPGEIREHNIQTKDEETKLVVIVLEKFGRRYIEALFH